MNGKNLQEGERDPLNRGPEWTFHGPVCFLSINSAPLTMLAVIAFSQDMLHVFTISPPEYLGAVYRDVEAAQRLAEKKLGIVGAVATWRGISA